MLTETQLNGAYWRLYVDGYMYRQGYIKELMLIAPYTDGKHVYIEHACGEGRITVRTPAPRSNLY